MELVIYIAVATIVVFIALFIAAKRGNNSLNNQDTYTEYLMNNGLSENDLNVIFAIEDIFSVNGRFIVTGTVIKGSIKVGDVLNYVDQNSIPKQANVIGIEAFRKNLDIANNGDKVGIMLDTTDKPIRGSYLFKKD